MIWALLAVLIVLDVAQLVVAVIVLRILLKAFEIVTDVSPKDLSATPKPDSRYKTL